MKQRQTTTLAFADTNNTLGIQRPKDYEQIAELSVKRQYFTAIILSISAALMLSGCATPISVKHVDIQTAYGIQTASALSSGKPSEASSIVLRQHGLLDRFETEPAVVLAELHKGVVTTNRRKFRPSHWAMVF